MTGDKKVLVLGVGNLLLKDEGVGIHAARSLSAKALPPNVEVMDGGTGGLDLLDAIEGREKVVIIDTMRGGHPPGTIYRMMAEDIEKRPMGSLSLHDVDVPHVLHVADMLGVKRPEIVVIGIEPKDMDTASLGLSPEIAAQIPKVVELVMKEVSQ